MAGMETLGGLAPWLWVAAAAALGAAELALGRPALIWAALAALLTALAAWLAPGLSGAAQLGLFLVLATALAGIGGSRFGAGGAAARARREGAAALVGREAEVVAFTFHEGEVLIDGTAWPARLDGAAQRTPAMGERMRVVATDGKVLWVARL